MIMKKMLNQEQRAKVLKLNLLETAKAATLLATEAILAVLGVACISDFFHINNQLMEQQTQNVQLKNLMGPDFEI